MVTRSRQDAFSKRTTVLTVVLLLFVMVITGRLFLLQVVHGGDYRLMADDQRVIYQKLMPTRGDIKIYDKSTDQNVPVATNIKKPLVYAVPGEIADPNKAADSLSGILGIEKRDLLDKLTQLPRKYVPLKKQLTDDEVARIKAAKLPGIYFDEEDLRVYPEKNLLSQVLGFVGYRGDRNDQRMGLYGLEKYFESDLAGKQGFLMQENDIAGSWIFGSSRESQQEEDGSNLVLTIDKSIQFKAENVLKDAVTKNEAVSGTIIVANPKTGAILAMANYPDYNPNEYNKVTDPKVFLNDATTGSYEPGSIFKPLTMAAAINEGAVTPNSTYTDTGSVQIDDYTIKNSDPTPHGVQTMTQVLDKSLNTGVIYAEQQIGNNKFYDYIKRFGFGKETGIELPESKGNLDNLKANIKVNFATASFGQGISVTPIQLIQAFTAIANGGKMMKPYIVQTKILADGEVEQASPAEVAQVVSPTTANEVSAMMVDVVENGHGKKAGVSGYYIAGKTGTAQIPKQNGRGYEENKNIGSFIGFGPVENPQFLMLVRINEPSTVKYAETTAAPAWGEMAQFILHYYNIPPTR